MDFFEKYPKFTIFCGLWADSFSLVFSKLTSTYLEDLSGRYFFLENKTNSYIFQTSLETFCSVSISDCHVSSQLFLAKIAFGKTCKSIMVFGI